MNGRLIALVAAVAVTASGCCARRLGALDGQLQALQRAKGQPGDAGATDAKLAAVATEARRGAAGCASLAPSFYRVGAVAAWQAGDAGAALVGPIAGEGAAACAAVPAATRPVRDCTLIRVAEPMAVKDALTRRQSAIRQRQVAAPNGALPAADRGQLVRVVQGYRAPFEQLTAIRRGLGGPETPAGLATEVDRKRLQVCCNTMTAWSLLGDVEGATMAELAAARGPLDACEASLRADGIAVAGPDTCKAAGGVARGAR
jgi:hypothetical protein